MGDVCVIGRQTVNLTPTDAKNLLKQEVGIDIAISHFKIDEDTRGAKLADKPFITDRSFFQALPGVRFHSLDVSNYEDADIIFDVTSALPDYLENRFDFIYNGSCLDNIFDPAAALKNFSRMLRPGGRIFSTERISRVHHAYVALSLTWFNDYYAINKFADCKVYLSIYQGENMEAADLNIYGFEPLIETPSGSTFALVDPPYHPHMNSHALVIAEKGKDSASNLSPIQGQYRVGDLEFGYEEGQRSFITSRGFVLGLGKAIRQVSPHFKNCGIIKGSSLMISDDSRRALRRAERRRLYNSDYLKRRIDELLLMTSRPKGESLSRMVIFGAGEHTAKLLQWTSLSERRIEFLIDENKELHGKQVLGLEVVSLHEALRRRTRFDDILISSAEYEEEIYLGLNAYRELSNARIFKLYEEFS